MGGLGPGPPAIPLNPALTLQAKTGTNRYKSAQQGRRGKEVKYNVQNWFYFLYSFAEFRKTHFGNIALFML